MVILTYALFVIGFILLIKGADLLVQGSSSLAKKFRISDLVVGLTIVSIGTSTPELFVNIMASLEGNAAIGVGNVLGSNIANVLLILGISALIFPLRVQRNTVLTEIPFSLTATLLVGFLANAAIFVEISLDSLAFTRTLYISRMDGLILFFFFFLFMGYIMKMANEQAFQEKLDIIMGRETQKEEDSSIKIMSGIKSGLYIVGGIAALFVGGEWVVDGAVLIARNIGFSDSFIGLTIIAVGTSLPELVTSATAAYRKNADIAVGNVVGSNIFNMLWILGLSALINPMEFELISNIDFLVIIGSGALLIFVLSIGKKYVIERWNGVLFLICYITYIIFLIQRG